MANVTHGTQNARGMQEQAGNVADKAKDAATSTMERAKDVAALAADKAKDLGRSAADMADNATAKVGSGIESVAGTLRDKAPHEGMVGTAANKVADTLERTGRYLEEEGLSGIAGDVTDLIKRNPIPALLVGIGIGFLLAQALRR
jgi:hypothetical protein